MIHYAPHFTSSGHFGSKYCEPAAYRFPPNSSLNLVLLSDAG